MMQDDVKYIRKTIQFEPEVLSQVVELAKSKKRTLPFMCNELLRSALKERKRKRRGKNEEDNS